MTISPLPLSNTRKNWIDVVDFQADVLARFERHDHDAERFFAVNKTLLKRAIFRREPSRCHPRTRSRCWWTRRAEFCVGRVPLPIAVQARASMSNVFRKMHAEMRRKRRSATLRMLERTLHGEACSQSSPRRFPLSRA